MLTLCGVYGRMSREGLMSPCQTVQ